MAATVHLVIGPAWSGKTERLIGRFRERPAGCLWLVSARRAIQPLRAGLGEASWIGTFQDFADELVRRHDPNTRPLSGVQRRLLVEEIVEVLHAEQPFKHFKTVLETRGFLEALLNQLAELVRHDTDPQKFDHDATGVLEHECARIYARYRETLRRHGWFDPDGRLWRATELIRQGKREPFNALAAILVDGFASFTAAELGLLESLAKVGDEMWITLPGEEGHERQQLFRQTEKMLEQLKILQPRFEYLASRPNWPAGLVHLERQLFAPREAAQKSSDATGVRIVKAPGAVGEARLAARAIKRLLLEGTSGDEILVVVRDLAPAADLLREVFADCGIPLDIEGTAALARNPATSLLLRALRLPDDDWRFRDVTALLRSTYFRPAWSEGTDPELPGKAELLLRMLGRPRGRNAYLAEVRRWAEEQQPGLEDEEAEESRRRRIHDLAKACLGFLEKFFQLWDGAPRIAGRREHVAWLRGFTDELGFSRAVTESEADRSALDRLWAELDVWQERGGRRAELLTQETFHRRLAALANEVGLARTARGPGRVRVLSAELARNVTVDHVFILGLGEGNFPFLATKPMLLDVAAGDLLADEMLLFYQVVTRARRQLVLSYPVVDDRGQEMLPGSFLLAAQNCFVKDAIPETKHRLLLEVFHEGDPLSLAEYRVRLALQGGDFGDKGLPTDLAANLKDAVLLAHSRLKVPEHNEFDGRFRDKVVLERVAADFCRENVFSPTALEDYLACPFRFMLRQALRLQENDDPGDDIAVTRRGQAFHRALSRLHRSLKEEGISRPTEAVAQRVREAIALAVAEDMGLAPSPAARKLWEIEGQRLEKLVERYPGQWQKFLDPWLERGTPPRPEYFEVSFGLPLGDGQPPAPPLIIRVDDIEVRISGRIDRLDITEHGEVTGFWIIDYKTGRTDYTKAELTEFRRVQLTLYALAAEEVVLAGRTARPLGLVYWQVGKKGTKTVLPEKPPRWLDEPQHWPELRERLRQQIATVVQRLRGGDFSVAPQYSKACEHCDFTTICRVKQCQKETPAP